jgi:catalase
MLPRFVQVRQIGHFYRANRDYGSRVANGLGIFMNEIIGKAA